jgi:hypothetical protein
MIGIPIAALLIATSMSAGGPEAMLLMLEGIVRQTFTAAAEFVRALL